MKYNSEIDSISASSKIVATLLAILLFSRCLPYFLWNIEDISRITCSILIPLICIPYLKFDKWNFAVFLIFLLSFIFLGISRENDFISLANILTLSLIPLLKRNFVITVFHYFKYIFTIFLLLSLVNFLLVLLFDIPASGIIEPINSLKSYQYNTYLFLIVPTETQYQFRFHGLFDEPGVIGTLSAIFLFTDKFKIKGWKNFILFVGGFLSFSLFFFIIVLVFKAIASKIKHLPLFIITIFIVYFSTYNLLYDYIWWRFEWDFYKTGLMGDNRTNETIKMAIAESMFSYNYFFGHKIDFPNHFLGEASIYVTIFRYGILFVFTNIIGYIVLAYKYLKKEKYILLITILFVILTFYQRPGLFDHVYIFLVTAIIKMALNENSEEKI